MRVLLFGTSNAIFRDGYQEGLKRGLPDGVFVNKSLGASPIDFVLYRMFRDPVEKGDLVLIESVVNDAASLRAFAYSTDRLKEVLRYIVDHVRAVGAVPVPLLLPPKFRDKHTLAAFESHREIYQELNVRFFDGLNWLETRSAAANRSFEDYFTDPAHMAADVACDFGAFVAAGLKEAYLEQPAKGCAYRLSFKPVLMDKNTFTNEKERPSIREFKNSLVEETLYSFRKSKIFVGIGNLKSLYGFVFDSLSTSSIALIGGQNSVLKDIRFENNPADTKLIVTPLIEPVLSSNGLVSIQNDNLPLEGRLIEKSYFAGKTENHTSEITLAGYLVKEPAY